MINRVENTLNLIWFLLVRITAAVALGYVIWRVRSVFVAVILSAMLAYVLLPAVEFLCSDRLFGLGKKTKRLFATVLVFVIFFAVVGGATKFLLAPFSHEADDFLVKLNHYSKQLNEKSEEAREWYVSKIPENWQEFVKQQDFNNLGNGIGKFANNVLHGTLEWLGSIIEIALIPVLAFYFVLDSRSLKKEFIGLLPQKRTREALLIMRDASAIMQSYVVGQIILCILAALLTGIVLHFIGMPYVLVLAVFAGITRAIPVVGPLASGVPICILGALQSTEIGLFLLFFMVVMHFVESKFIMPVLIGDRMKLHPAVILIVLLIGAELFGVMGMFLAAPVAAIIRELLNIYMVKPNREKGKKGRRIRKLPPSKIVKSEVGV